MDIDPTQFYDGKIVHRKIVASCRKQPFFQWALGISVTAPIREIQSVFKNILGLIGCNEAVAMAVDDASNGLRTVVTSDNDTE